MRRRRHGLLPGLPRTWPSTCTCGGPRLLEEVGISRISSPPPGRRLVPGPVTPEAASATGLPESASVAAGGHDHVCGALAAGVTQRHDAQLARYSEAIFLPLNARSRTPRSGTRVTPREPTWRASTTSSAASTLREPASMVASGPWRGRLRHLDRRGGRSAGRSAPSSCRTCASQTRRRRSRSERSVRRPQHGYGARSPLPGRTRRTGLRLPQLARTAPRPLRYR